MASTGHRPSGGSSSSCVCLQSLHQTWSTCISTCFADSAQLFADCSVSLSQCFISRQCTARMPMILCKLPCCFCDSSSSAHWCYNARPCTTSHISKAAQQQELAHCIDVPCPAEGPSSWSRPCATDRQRGGGRLRPGAATSRWRQLWSGSAWWLQVGRWIV